MVSLDWLCGVGTTALTSNRVSQDGGHTENPDEGEVMLTCTAVSTSKIAGMRATDNLCGTSTF